MTPEQFDQLLGFHRRQHEHNERLTHQLAELAREMRHLRNEFTSLKENVMAEIDDLKAAVAADQQVEQSAITLINGFGDLLTAALANGDKDLRAAVEDVATTVNTNAAALAAAVASGTPPTTGIPGSAGATTNAVPAAHEQVEAAKTAVKTDDTSK